MLIIGCDFHTRSQHIAMLDTETDDQVPGVAAKGKTQVDHTTQIFEGQCPQHGLKNPRSPYLPRPEGKVDIAVAAS